MIEAKSVLNEIEAHIDIRNRKSDNANISLTLQVTYIIIICD